MIVSIIAAMSRNRIIGRAGSLPWHIPADLSRFRQLTLGHWVIMGRKTFASIGRPLPGRKNIVISRNPACHAVGAETAASLAEALELASGDDEVFICGGGEVYRQAMASVSRIYLTVVDLDFEGDTYFPVIPANEFVEVSRERISESPPADLLILARRPAGEKVSRG